MDSLLSGLQGYVFSSAAAGAAAGFLGKVLLDRFTLANKRDVDVDTDMRKRRLDVYPELWRATSLLPKWPRNQNVTYEQLAELQNALRNWYFNTGGIFLSRSTFDEAYMPLQDKLTEITITRRHGPLPTVNEVIDGERDVYEEVRKACSKLRSALTRDVQSRREVPLWSFNL